MSGIAAGGVDHPGLAGLEPSVDTELSVLERRGEGWSPTVLRIGVTVLGSVIVASVLVRIVGFDPTAQSLQAVLEPPSLSHPFGTDDLGRDVFLRTIYASLTDLQIAAIATYVPLLVGLCIGVASGYLGGLVDATVMRLTDAVLAFPFIVLALAVIAIFGNSLAVIYAALMLKGLPTYIRITRGEMLVLREQEFILAARTLGFSRRRVIFRHAMPHLVRPNLVYSFSDLVLTIVALATLSFLGLGLEPPTPEWGLIIADGQTDLLGAWWISTLPGHFVVLVGLSISLAGEAFTERLRHGGLG